MEITVLAYSLSHNCLGRAFLLGQLLERNHEVDIAGPTEDGTVWEPVADQYEYTKLELTPTFPGFLSDISGCLESISGDLIYASKPRMTSYGFGMMKSIREGVPLLLDIDDWESGMAYGDHPWFVRYALGVTHIGDPNSYLYTRILERLSSRADALTVSNTFLRDRFGGRIIPHVRDTQIFDPSRFDMIESRRTLGLPTDITLVLFAGTPRPYKGVDDLLRAVSSLDRDDLRVVIMGARKTDYTDYLERLGGDQLLLFGPQPFDSLPEWIAAADIVAIPQNESRSTAGQIPAKLFDAMAMGKPIVATDVSDITSILDGCGRVVPPDSPAELGSAIQDLLDDPETRHRIGRLARERCRRRYSYDAVAPVLDHLVRSVVS